MLCCFHTPAWNGVTLRLGRASYPVANLQQAMFVQHCSSNNATVVHSSCMSFFHSILLYELAASAILAELCARHKISVSVHLVYVLYLLVGWNRIQGSTGCTLTCINQKPSML